MAADVPDMKVQRLADGFTSLMDEYDRLLSKSQALERNLAEAKAQLERFASEHNALTGGAAATPDIKPATRDIEDPVKRQARNSKWWTRPDLPMSKRNLLRTRNAFDTLHTMGLDRSDGDAMSKISSDVIQNGSSAMPSISESPLEQDFTVPGTPSRLDCPFASMGSRRLSAHAASVLSRYKPNGTMTPRSSASRMLNVPANPTSSPPPAVDISSPDAADVAAPDTGHDDDVVVTDPAAAQEHKEAPPQSSAPTCPIRFLDKTSPEQVADYFQKHRHEIPRSHEVCVKRYQGDQQSVRQLDAKYGNLVSMIQGLGMKHAPMLPDPERKDVHGDADIVREGDEGRDAESDERVRKWASNVSTVANAAEDSGAVQERDDALQAEERQAAAEVEDREGRFDRPLKDVRVGESPSRPWGIPVPASVLERAEEKLAREHHAVPAPEMTAVKQTPRGCPFAHGGALDAVGPHSERAAGVPKKVQPPPVFVASAEEAKKSSLPLPAGAVAPTSSMTFTGPVFIGYNAEQAAAVLKALQTTT